MPHISLQRAVQFPATLYYETLVNLLADISSRRGPWRDFTLHLSLTEFGLPDVGDITIPIHLRSQPETVVASAQERVTIHLEAARHPESLLSFSGVCGVDVVDAFRSTLWLDGSYELPRERALAAIEGGDEAMLQRMSEKALQNFSDDVVIACDARINQTEKDFIRYNYQGVV